MDKDKFNLPEGVGVAAGVLSAAVLAYCGYKLVSGKLQKTKYEPNPYKAYEEAFKDVSEEK